MAVTTPVRIREGTFLFNLFGVFVAVTAISKHWAELRSLARLAQLVERKTLNLVVVGSSPTVGNLYCVRTIRILDINLCTMYTLEASVV